MQEVRTGGLDIAKSVFHGRGAGAGGRQLFSRRLKRAKVLPFFAEQPCCLVSMEACGSSHHWVREIARLGHEVKLNRPVYVKSFVKRQKSDAADTEEIYEATTRPNMRFGATKSEEQR
jgi:transposase